MQKKSGFTKLPHGFQKRIGDLKDGKSYARLAVWLYHHCMEGKPGTSWPSLPTMSQELKLDENTIINARRWLRENGWLTKTGESAKHKGKFAVPIMATTIPYLMNGDGTVPVERVPTVPNERGGAVPNQEGRHRTQSTGTEVVPIEKVIPTEEATRKDLSDLNDLNEAFSSQTTEPSSSSYKKVEAFLDANFTDVPATQDEIEGIARLVSSWGDVEFEFLGKFIKSKKWNGTLLTPSDVWFRLRSKHNPLVLNDNKESLPLDVAKAVAGRARKEATQTQLESSAEEHDTSDLDLEREIKDKEMEAEYF